MLTRLRAFITHILPWYDERAAEQESQQTEHVIRRSQQQRRRGDRILTEAYRVQSLIERRHGDRGHHPERRHLA